MKKFIYKHTDVFCGAVLMAVSLASCADLEVADSMPNPSTDVVELRTDIVRGLDANYCHLDGFSRFTESKRYYTFRCTSGSAFHVPK